GEQGVNLEEGYLTFPAIPGGLLVRAGKMRAAFGKVNTLHNHVLPWTDRPLVISNLVGGEDGINDAGFSAARLIPNPWIFLEATGQVFRGDPNGVQNALGYYFSGDYQFARRWFAGIRYDRSKRADEASLTDKGQSAVLTYWPSEFSQVRGQYRRTQYATGPTANEFLMQFQ